jgi:hypothetical protein
MVGLLDAKADGFGTTSGVFFSLEGPLDPQGLPTLHESVGPSSPIFLMGIDAAADDYLQRYPITTHYTPDGGPFGGPHLLSAVPLQGVPLQPRTRYAVVVTTTLRDEAGKSLAPSPVVRQLAAGGDIAGLGDTPATEAARETYDLAMDALDSIGVAPAEVAGLSAFTTWEGTAPMHALVEEARSSAPPSADEGWSLTDVFDSYCVYESTLQMPVYQSGEPPYQDEGGGIVFEDGTPLLDHHELARIVVTIPRAPMPSGGWPVAVMVRTGGGGDRPLVDRGVRNEDGEVTVPGSGPALHFTAAGYAGVSVDGPHGGIRNVTGGDEQFLIFNIGNPTAMRDNIRQSALELALLPDILEPMAIDLSPTTLVCPDTGTEVRFDVSQLAIMGHSMGATISPLTLAVEPRYDAAILSGAGGSWIENVVHKLSPVAVRPLAEVLLGYPNAQRKLHEHDPVLTLLQWAGEPADPPIYASGVLDGTRHVLMLQGIVDTYILPPIANATSLSFGLDLAGAPLDEDHPELSDFRPLSEVLPYASREEIDLPASGNRDGATAVVVQHAEGPIEDGHEVVFQTPGPKHQYRCFLESLRTGASAPRVPVAGEPMDPCSP